MTRCIVFDFGNVIALFDHLVACQRLASLSRPPRDPQDVYERIFTTSLEEDYDCGRLSTATFVERLRRDLQLAASDEAIVRAWCAKRSFCVSKSPGKKTSSIGTTLARVSTPAVA